MAFPELHRLTTCTHKTFIMLVFLKNYTQIDDMYTQNDDMYTRNVYNVSIPPELHTE